MMMMLRTLMLITIHLNWQVSDMHFLRTLKKRAHMLRMQQLDVEHNESSKELVMQQYQMQLSSFSSLAGYFAGLGE